MDVLFPFRGERFVWDSEKAAINLKKHGVSFEMAAYVLFDPLAIFEDATDGSESRQAALGVTLNETLLYVVHVIRELGYIRIVSARESTKSERKRYEESQ